MTENTNIEWCDDSVDFWRGRKPRMWNRSAPEKLLALNRKAEREGRKRLVFINSMSDLFEDYDGPIVDRDGHQMLINAPESEGANGAIYNDCYPVDDDWGCRELTLDDLRRRFFLAVDHCQSLICICLTKRPENIRRMWHGYTHGASSPFAPTSFEQGSPQPKRRDNIWLLTSVSDQETADRNIPELLKCGDLAPVLGVSCEPLLGPVSLEDALSLEIDQYGSWRCQRKFGLSWCIIGGESGPKARECDMYNIQSLIEQCQAAGVPAFVKQLGAKPFIPGSGGLRFDFNCSWDVKENRTDFFPNDPKGGDPTEWPARFRVRQFPN